MYPYFERSGVDAAFYDAHVRDRMPARVFDVHVHVNLPEHVRDVTRERILSDWAMECGHTLPVEDALRCAAELFPGVRYKIAGFPFPIREADLPANNRYLAEKARQGLLTALMCVRPEWDAEDVERQLLEGGFAGFKPYPDMVAGRKGAAVGIGDFMPSSQWEILDRNSKVVMLHIPRAGRLADDDNVRELLDFRQRFPRVKIIVAHFGRSFCPGYLSGGLQKLGGAAGFFFDTSGVINPAVYDIAFSRIDPHTILFGTDMPIFFWHGKREWTETTYINLTSAPYSWNTNRRPAETEEKYTVFLYEQVRAILDAMERHSFDPRMKKAVFHDNAAKLFVRPGKVG